MSDWAVGLSTGCFYRKSIFECLETILKNGFPMIEVCSYPDHLDYHDLNALKNVSRLMNDLHMEAYSFHAPFADHIDISSLDEHRRHESVKEILCAAEAAALLEVRHFVIHPGPEREARPASQEKFERLRHTAEALNTIAQRCNELGMRCLLENKLPHLIFGNTGDLLWILGNMAQVDIGICLDTGHAFLSGDLDSVMHKLSGHLEMLHACDNRGERDDHLPPGEGSIDWDRLLTKLSEVDFRNTIILEIAGDGEPGEILKRARRSRKFLRSIGRRLSVSSPPTVPIPMSKD